MAEEIVIDKYNKSISVFQYVFFIAWRKCSCFIISNINKIINSTLPLRSAKQDRYRRHVFHEVSYVHAELIIKKNGIK